MLVLKNANVFDGINEKIVKNATVVLDGAEIKEIIPNCNKAFENEEVIDLKGKYVTPGFIDCHVHFMLDEVPDKERMLNDHSAGGVIFSNVDSYVAFRAVENAKKTLKAGFTTVVDGGGVDYVDVALKDAIKRLPDREKEIIKLRYFDGKTQMEVSKMVRISQAQVSRLEKSAIKNMENYLRRS